MDTENHSLQEATHDQNQILGPHQLNRFSNWKMPIGKVSLTTHGQIEMQLVLK